MKLTADYHTHTVYSHGKDGVMDNALFAKENGLLELGITDHGFNHPAFGLRRSELGKLRIDCENAKKETGVKVLMGIESNFIGLDGTVDLRPSLYDKFDLFLAGLHKFVLAKPEMLLKVSISDMMRKNKSEVSKSLIKNNTKAFVNVIKKNPVDIITHLNYCCYADPLEVAKVASDYGTYIEISSRKLHLTDEEFYKILSTGVNFIINSDAHRKEDVGKVEFATEIVERLNIPEERIHNVNGKLPNFRFKAFKEKSL